MPYPLHNALPMIIGNPFSFEIEHEPKGGSLMLNNGLVGNGYLVEASSSWGAKPKIKTPLGFLGI